MSHLTTTNPASRATRAHRAQIVAEAVISAYINEMTPTERPRERARPRHSCTDSAPRAIARTPLAGRARGRTLAPRRRTALQLGA
jgi:hypothetical protein